MPQQFEQLPVERVIFGHGSIAALDVLARQAKCGRVFVITSPSVSRTSLLAEVLEVLGSDVAYVFERVEPHVPHTLAFEAAAAFREAEADTIVTVGGSSATDTGKAVRLIEAVEAEGPEGLVPYRTLRNEDEPRAPRPLTSLAGRISRPVVKQIAIPTTLSGGEFTDSCAITDTTVGVKRLHVHRELVPTMVVLDPQAATETPLALWVSTGIKAVDHCVEQMLSLDHQAYTDALCGRALGMLLAGLRASIEDPSDLEAKARCQTGAWLAIAGIMNVPLGISHAIGHQLGGGLGVPHGVTSCLSLPAVLRALAHEKPEALEPLLRSIAQELELSISDGYELAAYIAELVEKGGVPTRLRDAGISRERVASISEAVAHDPLLGPGPLDVENPTVLESILEAMW